MTAPEASATARPRRLSKMSQSIQGRVAIVTGGASGIGRACVHVLADGGAKIAVVDIGQERVDKVVAEVREVYGEASVRGWECDVTKGDRVIEVVNEVASHFGHIDILINSAGVGSITGQYNIHSDDETFFKNYDGTLDINLNGTMRFIKVCTPHLIKSAAASLAPGTEHTENLTTTSRIINVSSSAGLYTTASLGYDTSKHGVLGLTKAACAQLGPKGITVNALCPGLVRTPLTSAADDMFVALGKQVPNGRAAEPEDVAHLAYALCLPSLSYVNGQSIVVDGGWCNMLNGWPYAFLVAQPSS
ncbi:NAD(P)-binding protein [Gonapodya prolifera JEL478]|uniref:NAD(P)-binding protein n=1 Tax=Gonapodya prolifera (strain JEL478) TaxID=1344416 RepID=A0A139A176_GONPJ|nr:NAD(P)-binding protein [Gonapodya prolifera JEL478]|eukprot:KXS10540.1 NAD(P)-binding protein [Gonapodya prolifera JEL478]